MRHLGHHALHILMCAPMIVIAAIAIATGSGLATLVPVIACMAMMMMMGSMGGGSHDRHRE